MSQWGLRDSSLCVFCSCPQNLPELPLCLDNVLSTRFVSFSSCRLWCSLKCQRTMLLEPLSQRTACHFALVRGLCHHSVRFTVVFFRQDLRFFCFCAFKCQKKMLLGALSQQCSILTNSQELTTIVTEAGQSKPPRDPDIATQNITSIGVFGEA